MAKVECIYTRNGGKNAGKVERHTISGAFAQPWTNLDGTVTVNTVFWVDGIYGKFTLARPGLVASGNKFFVGGTEADEATALAALGGHTTKPEGLGQAQQDAGAKQQKSEQPAPQQVQVGSGLSGKRALISGMLSSVPDAELDELLDVVFALAAGRKLAGRTKSTEPSTNGQPSTRVPF